METLTIPTDADIKSLVDFEEYLNNHAFKFKKKQDKGVMYYIVEIVEPLDAFYIGCNFVAKINGLFKGPLTK